MILIVLNNKWNIFLKMHDTFVVREQEVLDDSSRDEDGILAMISYIHSLEVFMNFSRCKEAKPKVPS